VQFISSAGEILGRSRAGVLESATAARPNLPGGRARQEGHRFDRLDLSPAAGWFEWRGHFRVCVPRGGVRTEMGVVWDERTGPAGAANKVLVLLRPVHSRRSYLFIYVLLKNGRTVRKVVGEIINK
jgi:hypothetical protein